ncbi:MAG: serine/threonine-protein kinase [Phycisphaerae bacterium]|nr:serine/threonine-protein kinase [Phycisphaerae bacterium]
MRDETPAPHDARSDPPRGFLALPFLGADFHVARAMHDAAMPSELPMPERVRSFTIGALIGSGTFASVYSATQDQPVSRRVALKVLHAGIDHRSARQRFLREQQSLARLEHPGIARLYESGMTPDARLYFAMEFVDGETIIDAATRHHLSVAQRVRLVRDTCRAVNHAHVKGLIHRDLKPSNILVSTIEKELAVKVIDFGVAKAIGSPIDASSLRTVAVQLVGTPAYMAPEQLEGRVGDVDVRSDIYSLGAVLYELLSGGRPHRTCGRAPGDAARLIRAHRPRPLRGAVAGVSDDLDRAVACALSAEPDDRYQSAAEFAADLDRIINGEPILARAPGAWESALRWSRRHPIPTALAIAVMAGLATTATLSWTFARSAAMELRSAEREIDMALAVIEEFINAAARLADRSGVVAERRSFIEKAVAMTGELLLLHPERSKLQRVRADALLELSKILRDATPSEMAEARALCADGLTTLARLVADGGSDDDRRAHAIALILCGDIEKEEGDLAEAHRRYEQALVEHEALSAEFPNDLGSARQSILGLERLGHLAELKQEWATAEHYYRRQLAGIEALCSARPDRVDLLWDRCLARAHFFCFPEIGVEVDAAYLKETLVRVEASCADASILLATDPNSHPYRDLLARCQVQKSQLLRLLGDNDGAKGLLVEARAVLEDLAAADPTYIDVQGRLTSALCEEARGLQAVGDIEGAFRISDRVVAI